MEKQELIERLNNKLDETFAFQQSFKPLTWTHMECESKTNAYMTAINYVEQLGESEENLASTIKLLTNLEPDDFLKELKLYGLAKEPQKVTVPQFVAEWFEENKHNLNFAIYELCEAGKVPVDLYEGLSAFERWFYLNHDIETLIRMQDGYEVEEEPKWIVCYSTMYLKSPLETGQIESVEITPKKELAYHFKSYKEAKQQTSLIGGAVDKAEV